MSKIIQMTDADGNVYPKEPTLVDISSSFTYALGVGTGTAYVKYDRASRTVKGEFFVHCGSSNTFSTTANMFTIATAYRPTSDTGFACVVVSTAGLGAYRGVIAASGGITQKLSGTAYECFGSFEYSI